MLPNPTGLYWLAVNQRRAIRVAIIVLIGHTGMFAIPTAASALASAGYGQSVIHSVRWFSLLTVLVGGVMGAITISRLLRMLGVATGYRVLAMLLTGIPFLGILGAGFLIGIAVRSKRILTAAGLNPGYFGLHRESLARLKSLPAGTALEADPFRSDEK